MPEEKTVMDAVNAALDDTIDTPETDDAADDSAVPSPDSEGDLGDDSTDSAESDSEGDGAGEGKTEDDSEPEGEQGPNGERERNPDGTWKKVEPKVEDKKGGDKKEPPKKDPINDPIPQNLKKETQDRMRSLIDTARELTASRDEVQKNFDYMVGGIQATGATPEQYGETLSWLALFNSRDPVQQEKALELVENVAERLATLLGKERAIGDPLSAHADLKDAVAKGQITAQYAKEIARTRNGQQFRTELTTTAQKDQQQRDNAAREEHEGRLALTELEKTLMASDPDYLAKKAILVPALKPVMQGIPWSQRKDKFLEAYKNLPFQRAAASAKPRGVPVNQPLRAGKQPAGGQTKAPSSMLEAISGAIEGMKK